MRRASVDVSGFYYSIPVLGSPDEVGDDIELTITDVTYSKGRPATYWEPEEPAEIDFDKIILAGDLSRTDLLEARSDLPIDWHNTLQEAVSQWLHEQAEEFRPEPPERDYD